MPVATTAELQGILAWLEPWRRIWRPTFIGMERVPAQRPLFFVGNHTLYGVLDAPLFLAEVFAQHGLFLRALGDHVHFRIPGWRELLSRVGVVDGTRENAAALLAAGESLLVFPGGGREVSKRKGERYQLIWKERLGFAKLAIEHGAAIVPFSAIGVEDAYDIVFDANDLFATRLGPFFKSLGLREDVFLPLAVGWRKLPLIPRRERLWFHVADPIDVAPYAGDASDENARDLRDRTRAAVEAGIATLMALRDEASAARPPE